MSFFQVFQKRQKAELNTKYDDFGKNKNILLKKRLYFKSVTLRSNEHDENGCAAF